VKCLFVGRTLIGEFDRHVKESTGKGNTLLRGPKWGTWRRFFYREFWVLGGSWKWGTFYSINLGSFFGYRLCQEPESGGDLELVWRTRAPI